MSTTPPPKFTAFPCTSPESSAQAKISPTWQMGEDEGLRTPITPELRS